MRLIDYFDASAQRYPSKTAFIQPDGAHLTYAEVEQQSRRIAAALHASALPETGKVAVYSPNDARAFDLSTKSITAATTPSSISRSWAPSRRQGASTPLGFIALEGVWTAISLFAFVRTVRRRSSGA